MGEAVNFRGARLSNFTDEFPVMPVPEDGTAEQLAEFVRAAVWACEGHRQPLHVLRDMSGWHGRAYCCNCVCDQMSKRWELL